MIYDLSIIIPFYNSKKFINRSLKNSLEISKKNHNVEIIYVNNNSKDLSSSIIKNKIKNSKNIKIFKTIKKNGMGPGIARNLGIKKANSKFLIFLDVDDYIEIKYLNQLIEYCKKFKNNFIFLGIKTSKKISPYLNYSKNNLKNFFRKSNNMLAIAKVIKKQFLIKNNLIFSKGIFEDIFFTFKCHFYNDKKIDYFSKKIYVKKENPNSITNSKKTLNHIKHKFNAFKAVDFFLRKKNYKIFNKLFKDIQHRWRGEFCNEYNHIINSKLKKKEKEIFVNYTKKLYKNYISNEFKIITYKDKITKEKLFNV